MAAGLYNPGKSTPVLSRIEYAVNTTGDVMFNPTIGTSDSPDYSDATDKAAAVAQVVINSPLAEEVVAS